MNRAAKKNGAMSAVRYVQEDAYENIPTYDSLGDDICRRILLEATSNGAHAIGYGQGWEGYFVAVCIQRRRNDSVKRCSTDVFMAVN